MPHHKDVTVIPNKELHDHVTSAQFLLSIPKTGVEFLHWLRNHEKDPFETPICIGTRSMSAVYGKGPTSHAVQTGQMLARRGLIVYATQDMRRRELRIARGKEVPHPTTNGDLFRLTRAGRAAITLLEEAGLIPLPTVAEKPKRRSKAS